MAHRRELGVHVPCVPPPPCSAAYALRCGRCLIHGVEKILNYRLFISETIGDRPIVATHYRGIPRKIPLTITESGS